MKNFKMMQLMAISATLSLVLTGCFENQYFFKLAGDDATTTTAPSTSTNTAPDTQTAVTFKKLQPALAVRGSSCLMCHAQVSSNVITDYGYGNDYFLDHNGVYANGQGIYSDWSGSWASAVIGASVIVPKVSLDTSYQIASSMSSGSTESLATALQKSGMLSGVSPAAGASGVIEKSKIYIGAPTESDLSALAPTLTTTGFQAVSVKGITPNASLPLSGLTVVNGSNGIYVANDTNRNFVCAGDVVIRGNLFLNQPNIQTDALGCRLYVIGSVFVQGAITYVGAALTTENLQITSSRAIMMGFNVSTARTRLSLAEGDDYNRSNYLLNNFMTRAPGSTQDKLKQIIADAKTIDGLQDAGGSSTDTDNLPDSVKLKFTRLLLNAPQVHSRYAGDFKGVVIAEIAIFRIGVFSFTFDSIFQQVPALPALSTDILTVQD